MKKYATKNEFTKAAHDAGWTLVALREALGYSERGMQKIASNPKQRHWDMLRGVGERGRRK